MASNAQFAPAVSTLKPDEFVWIARFLYERTGISLNEGKQALVMGRLEKRLRKQGLSSYREYFSLLGRPGYEDETVMAIDLLTTNETYFFREHKHFEFLQKVIFPQHPRQRMRVWSAASSSGEEAYTIAMTLAAFFPGDNWEVLGSDISTRMLEKARRALYPMLAAEKIPPAMLKKYCLKGRDEYEDFFLVDPLVTAKVTFRELNLVGNLPDIGEFDIIFLRNVMIYFDIETKQRLLQRIVEKLRPGGYFIVSHSESLNGISNALTLIQPSIYQRPS